VFNTQNRRMFANSAAVSSNQPDVHPGLENRVRVHLANAWRKPESAYTTQAWQAFAARWRGEPLILDSGCGTAESTQLLAESRPDALVLGLDQSQARLSRARVRAPNALLLRAECAEFWRRLAAEGVRLDEHWLCYPNPWPKAEHLSRRWHGHPGFPSLLALGGRLELRSNWEIYAREFAVALDVAGVDCHVEPLAEPSGISAFERKYQASGHALWRVQARIAAGPVEFELVVGGGC
jgi:tRNA (guanine-N7-)-methyltransferase